MPHDVVLSEKLPIDVLEKIAQSLKSDEDALRALCLTNGVLNVAARPVLFHNVTVHSAARLEELIDILYSPHGNTVPRKVRALVIRIPHPQPTDRQYEGRRIQGCLWNLLHHYRNVQTFLSLDLPWIISRHGVIWNYMRAFGNLKKFVLRGIYSSIEELVRVLPYFQSLESLVVDAAWKDEGQLSGQPATTVSTSLTELSLSGSSLALLPWMCSLQTGPTALHLLRLKVDGVTSHSVPFQSIHHFFGRYGSRLVHLYLWLEECPDSAFEQLGTALPSAPDLFQLALFLPSDRFHHDPEIEKCTNAILRGGEPPLVEVEDAFQLENEGNFWAEPSINCARKEAHVGIEY